MQCSFCHSLLTPLQTQSKTILTLCCTVNQIFCLHCLYSPSLIEYWICNNTKIECEGCHCWIDGVALLRKRLEINLGTYRAEGRDGLRYGWTYFAEENGKGKGKGDMLARNFNYGDIFEVQNIGRFNGSGRKETGGSMSAKKGSSLFDTADSQKSNTNFQSSGKKSFLFSPSTPKRPSQWPNDP